MSSIEDDEWLEITEDLFREPGTLPTKIKLYADANVSKQLVDAIRQADVSIHTVYEDRINTQAGSEYSGLGEEV